MAATGEQEQAKVACEESPLKFQTAFARENSGNVDEVYQFDKAKLGEGAFGICFKAKCIKTGVARAVKSIDRQRLKNPAKFEHEINIAKQLDHPNVVRLFETFRDAKRFYLVMELCTGRELFDKIVDDAPRGFGEPDAAGYVRQMLAAIGYLHAQRFAHRDVKPENFLLSSDAADASLKLIDFGLSCQFVPGVGMKSKVGSANYVAPEVLLNASYDEMVDIWSIGVVSFILLCGYPPFGGRNDQQTYALVKRGTFSFRSPEWDNVSQDAKSLLGKMLTKDPQARPAAEELLKEQWLTLAGTPASVPIGKDFATRLQQFRAHSRLKKVALTAVAQQLPDESIEPLQRLFKSLDKDGNGTLSPQEVQEGLTQHGLDIPPALEDILKSIDCNGSGELDYTEFLAATIDKKLYQRQDVCWAAFRIFDLDGDGKITREELQKVLNGGNVQQALGAGQIEKLIKEADINKDGVVDFEEFCKMMEQPAQDQRRRIRGKRPNPDA